MNFMKFAVMAVFLASGSAFAQEVEKKVAIKVVVDGDESSTVSWSGSTEFDDLAVGETRTITTDSGKDITITKTDAGMEFNVNGETVMVPDVGEHGMHMAFVGADGIHAIDGDIDVEVMALDGHETVDVKVIGAGTHAVRAHPPEGVTIISDQPLDDSVRESIRSVLISAGNDSEVRFIDGTGDGEHVRVIEKRVEIQQ